MLPPGDCVNVYLIESLHPLAVLKTKKYCAPFTGELMVKEELVAPAIKAKGDAVYHL